MPEERVAPLPAKNYIPDEGLMSRSSGRSRKILFDVRFFNFSGGVDFFSDALLAGDQKIPDSYDYYYHSKMMII
jgi:hypothetical protein